LYLKRRKTRVRKSLCCAGRPMADSLIKTLRASYITLVRQSPVARWRISLLTFEVTALELKIIPNLSGGDARASLTQWRLAS
jgi:hypothetical protein